MMVKPIHKLGQVVFEDIGVEARGYVEAAFLFFVTVASSIDASCSKTCSSQVLGAASCVILATGVRVL